ncbi:hypothetical protein [Paraburkholderia sp. C35]|uniref:hypothetical protein n=1 Tax=Paraburkholderia sp. C35 TaxID=2126993 RepID=UPI000D68C97C|nr:hypothetical protein [Paraburkholderia sp. C35]
MKIRFKSAGTSATVLAVAVSVLGMSGCASIAGGSQAIGNAVGVKDRSNASALGGCLAGGVVGAGAGAIAGKNFFSAGLGFITGCAAGGAISYAASVKVQLDEVRRQQAEINGTLASVRANQQAMVVTKLVNDPQHENHKIEAWDKTVVPMPPGHGADVDAVLKKVAALTAASKKVPRIDVYVKRVDESAYSEILNAGLQGTKVTFATHIVTKNPHLDVTPIPDPSPAAQKAAPATAASGPIYQPSTK